MWCLGAIVWFASAGLCFPATGIPPEKRRNFTAYDYNGPLKLHKMLWSSAQVATAVMQTVFEEVFGYHVDSSDAGWSSQNAMKSLSGCQKYTEGDQKGKYINCAENDIRNPVTHLSFEVWRYQVPKDIPKETLPENYGTLEYMGEEGVYMLPATAEKFYKPGGRIITSYLGWNSDVYNDFADHFMTLRQLLNVSGWKDGVAPGSMLADIGTLNRIIAMHTSSSRTKENATIVDYEWSTGDSATNPSCYDLTTETLSPFGKGCGTVWVAPASRADPLGCIPIITSGDWGYFLVPMAAKFKWPVCYISADWGNYVYVGRTFNILTYWWTPDTTFTSRNFVEVGVPGANGLARAKGDFSTKVQTKLDVLGWKFVREGDAGKGQFLAKFALDMGWFDPDPKAWMQSVQRGLSNVEAGCEWLQVNEDRWRAWVPPMEPPCPVGQELDGASGECQQCPLGSHASEANRKRIIWNCVTCDPGLFQNVIGSAICNQCGQGQFTSTPGASQCSDCSAGFFQRGVGQSECSACAPGSFTAKRGQPTCENCPVGFYQSEEAQTGCEACPASFTTEYPGATSLSQCTCAAGDFWDRKEDVCKRCQNGGECRGGLEAPTVWGDNYGVYVGSPYTLSQPDNYVQSKADGQDVKDGFAKLQIYACRKGQCVNEPGKCPERRTGIACAICEAGNYATDCRPCGDGVFVLFIILLILFPFAMWGGAAFLAQPYEAKPTAAFGVVATLGIMVLFMQLLGIMSGFNVYWPFSFGSLFSIGRIFLLDLEGLGVGCMVGNGFGQQYHTSLLLPLLIVVVLVVCVVPLSFVVPRIGGFATKVDFDAAINFLGMIYTALYISLVKIVTSLFECVANPDADPTLMKFKQVVCSSDEHAGGTPIMVFGMLFYVVGFLGICLYLTMTAPAKFSDLAFRNRCKFLVSRWRVDVWYWGTFYMVRNLMLAFIAVISSTAVDQLILMGIIVLLSLMATAAHMPWRDDRLGQLDNAIALIILLTVFCGIGFMHLSAGKGYYARDTSGRATKAIADADARIGGFSAVLNLALVVTVLLFLACIGYWVYCINNATRLSRLEEEDHKLLVLRWKRTVNHNNFGKQFDRFITIGTHQDMLSLYDFLANMETQLGYAEEAVEGNRKSKRTSARLRTSFRAAEATAREISFDTSAKQTV